MDDRKDSQLTSIIYMFRFVLFALLFLLIFLFDKVPQLVLPIGSILLLFGVFAFSYGMRTTKKYKGVLDYEKIKFLGKERNAIQVRTFLQGFGFTGLWFIVIGFISLCPTIDSYSENRYPLPIEEWDFSNRVVSVIFFKRRNGFILGEKTASALKILSGKGK